MLFRTSFHNDRKRRDNINDRIQEILMLIPANYFQDYYLSGSNSNSNNNEISINNETKNCSRNNSTSGEVKVRGTGTKDGKPNKGQILTKAVEYIVKLQKQVDAKNREEVALMMKVQRLSKKTGTIVTDINLENTSGEVDLAKIGVGPLADLHTPQDDIMAKQSHVF